jgi:hypothetical protein
VDTNKWTARTEKVEDFCSQILAEFFSLDGEEKSTSRAT